MAVVSPSMDPEMRGAMMTENFTRTLEGLDKLQGVELDRFQRRREQQAMRQDQLAEMEQALSDRQIQAEELEGSLRRAGMADVAQRLRNASRRQQFNAARRGVQGGSVDVQQRAALEAQGQQAAEGVEQQVAQAGVQRRLGDLQSAAGIRQGLISQDPLEQAILGSELQQERDTTQQINAEQALLRQLAESRRRSGGALGGAIGGTIGSLGSVVGAGLAGSA